MSSFKISMHHFSKFIMVRKNETNMKKKTLKRCKKNMKENVAK